MLQPVRIRMNWLKPLSPERPRFAGEVKRIGRRSVEGHQTSPSHAANLLPPIFFVGWQLVL